MLFDSQFYSMINFFPCFRACDERIYHGKDNMAEQSHSSHESQEVKEKEERSQT
jgi:hypothetical protein